MSESHFDEYEHFNFDQEKNMFSGHSGKQRSKKEAAMNTNHFNPGGHERKIVEKFHNHETKVKLNRKLSKSLLNYSWDRYLLTAPGNWRSLRYVGRLDRGSKSSSSAPWTQCHRSHLWHPY
ncbi:hypothetical protein TCAL_02371 [Tigriopus californicus]|uniref:Nuclear protein 1 n=1 Tax=Tigriopus californicus TaxID=6832 RepID=A0A553P0G5_TIGCA|nr:hypothetical protein TCAL_02371 [Tigriopus californicus]